MLQFDVVLDQGAEQRLHVGLIRKRLVLPRLSFDREHSDGERLLHQMQIASPKLGNAVTSRKKIEQLRTAARKNHCHIFAAMRRRLRLHCTRAAVVVEARPSELYLTETTAMIVLGLALSLFAVGFLCWLLFTLAVYATPLFVGVTAALAAFNHDAGAIGALIVGLAAGVVTLVGCRVAFALAKSPTVRSALALVFAAPAAVAGFHATLGLAQIGVSSEIWRDLFAVVGAVIVCCTAFVRLVRAADPISHERSIAFISAKSPSPPLARSTTRD